MSSGYPINLGLGDAPDPALDAAVWQELNKLQLAAKFIAQAMGFVSLTNEAIAGIPGLENVTVQNYAKVKKLTPIRIPAGSIVELENATDIHLTSSAHPYPVGFCETETPAGGIAELILLGMCHYAPSNLTPGAKYYLNLATPGQITTLPGGRFVGQAFAINALWFDPVRS